MAVRRNSEKQLYDFLYDVMKGNAKDYAATKEKDEAGMFIYQEVPVALSLRIKAAEMLFKSVQGQSDGTGEALPVVICEDL